MRDLEQLLDGEQIRRLVQRFCSRDEHHWAELAGMFAADATVSLSWYHGSAAGFVEACKQLAARHKEAGFAESLVKHTLGCPRIRVSADRAFGDTDAQVLMRLRTGPNQELVDVTSWVRFCDFIARRDGEWKIVHRTAIYEKDRLDPVMPGTDLEGALDRAKLDQLPFQFRYLAYTLAEGGLTIFDSTILAGTERQEKLLSLAPDWLSGRNFAFLELL